MRNATKTEAVLAMCLRMPVAEFRRLAPFEWRHLPMNFTGVPPGASCDDLGLWFTAGNPVEVILCVSPTGIALMPPNGRQTGRNRITFDIDPSDGLIPITYNEPDFQRRLSAALRMMAKQTRKRNCQGLAK